MSFTHDGVLDADEALRLVEAAAAGQGGSDMVMSMEARGNPVAGESERSYNDGRKRMDIAGYWTTMRSIQAGSGSGRRRVTLDGMHIVRPCDVATATFASLHKAQDESIKVTLSMFKAGGDNSSDAQPTLELEMTKVRIISHTLVTGGSPKIPWEILGLSYRTLEIRSAPQTTIGTRGALSVCSFEEA